jgi:hypothetical protein
MYNLISHNTYYNGWGLAFAHAGSGKYTINVIMRRYWPNEGYYAAFNLEPLSYHRLYHICINYDPVNLFAMYVNGRKIAIQQAVPLGVIQGSIWDYGKPQFHLGGTPNLHNTYQYFTNGYFGQLAFFARRLSEQEIVFIKDNGGILPASTHKYCIAHYPCNQADGDRVFSSESSFNYTREEAENFRQPLINSSREFDFNDEITLLIYPEQERSHMLRIVADNGNAYYCYHANNQIKAGDNIGGHKIRATVDIGPYHNRMRMVYSGGWLKVLYKYNGSYYTLDQFPAGDLKGYQFFVQAGTAIPYQSVLVESKLGINYAFNDTNSTESIAYGNKITKIGRVTQGYPLSLANFSASSCVGYQQTAYKDFYSRQNYRPYKDSNHDSVPDSPLVAVSSEMAPAVNAVYFDKAKSQRAVLPDTFGPSSEKGYTVLINFFHPQTSFTTDYGDCLFSKRVPGDTNQGFFCYGFGDVLNIRGHGLGNVGIYKKYLNLGQGISQLVASFMPMDTNSHRVILYGNGIKAEERVIPHFLNSLDQLSSALNLAYDVYGSGRYYSGHLISFGLAKGIITGQQVHELWNNSLLAAPKSSWKNLEWQCYLDFNQVLSSGTFYYLNGFNGITGRLYNFSQADTTSAITNINQFRA